MRIACCAPLFAACNGGGSGGGGAVLSPTDSGSANTSSVDLAWRNANGPVAGYAVYVERGNGGFNHEVDIPQANVTLTGTPGESARVIVVAYDAKHRFGPGSAPSPRFRFPAPATETQASAATAEPDAEAPAATARALATQSDARPADGDPDPESPSDAVLEGALVWQAGDALRVTDGSLETELLFSRPSDGAQLVAVSDFDGDGQGDLLWVSNSGEVAYTPAASLELGASETPVTDIGTLREDERVLGAGDFDGDGHGDLLVDRAGATIDAWFTTPDAAPRVAELGTAAQARLAGVADLDANGTDDVVWRASDSLVVWLMDGSRAGTSVEVALGSGLEVTGTGDFDGNGAAELAVRDPNGDVFIVRPLMEPVVLEATDVANASSWRTAGSADLDRDGTDELVLAGAEAIRIAGMPGDEVLPLDAGSPWQLIALLP